MSPEDMAATGAWTRSAYDRLLAHINGIKDKAATRPGPGPGASPRSPRCSRRKAHPVLPRLAGGGGKGHHYYPGGLPVHALEWVDVAMAWADACEKIYKVKKIDRDLVDCGRWCSTTWAKVWYEWDPKHRGRWSSPRGTRGRGAGSRARPSGSGWASTARWSMRSSIHRGAPEGLIVGYRGLAFRSPLGSGQGRRGAQPGAGRGRQDRRQAGHRVSAAAASRWPEWWFSNLHRRLPGPISHYIAGFTAIEAVEAVARTWAWPPARSRPTSSSWFVLSRVSDYRIYEVYQRPASRWTRRRAHRFNLKDSAPYEVPKR